MAIISLDLAIRRYEDNGLTVMAARGGAIECELLSLSAALSGAPDVAALADHLAALAARVRARFILIDGPQAWKSPDNGHAFQRCCEKDLRTPGKTGEPGVVKPRTWTRFAEFSIRLFDALEERGWPRLGADPAHGEAEAVDASDGSGVSRAAIESFPTAAWRSLGLKPLPSKTRCGEEIARAARRTLVERFSADITGRPTHDELQAIVAGLAGIALEHGRLDCLDCVGAPPRVIDGTWREGFIVLPRAPSLGVLRGSADVEAHVR